MDIEVRDDTGTIISTGVMTEMGPVFSPSIPDEIHLAFKQYIAEHPGQSGTWQAWVGEKRYTLRF